MARIELCGVAHRYRGATQPALQPLDMTWEDGGAYALLGPSGCGKTTLLNIISGLLRPSEGRVLFDGRDVTQAPTQARNIAQVFQFPVIYDTMTVFDNLAFPLRNRRVDAATVRSQVERVAQLLELREDLERRARGLPAEMQQRLSLGRGLVRQDVAALLLDEPLTVIDPHVKWLLRRKLMQIHAELRLTLIYVTHDQFEALTLADQVVVMRDGAVLQQGSGQALFDSPAHTFVGHFIGSPGMNLLPCTIAGDVLRCAEAQLPLPEGISVTDGALTLGIRPEGVLVHAHPTEAPNVAGQIVRIDDHGRHKVVHAELPDKHTVAAIVPAEASLTAQQRCWLEFPPAWLRLFADDRAVALPK